MDYMKDIPDKYFDLAIVDPPYGIAETSYRKTPNKKCAAKKKKYNTALWKFDKPDVEYWDNLMRISKNQIIWGGNYFTSFLYESRCWIVWDKCTQDSKFADVELAWTSYQNSAKLFKYRWNGMLQENMGDKEVRIHPTQKPIQLYKWLLKNYAKPEFKIIDTHLGSGSSAIAAYDFGIAEFIGTEIDKEYYDAAVKRFNIHKMQKQIQF